MSTDSGVERTSSKGLCEGASGDRPISTLQRALLASSTKDVSVYVLLGASAGRKGKIVTQVRMSCLYVHLLSIPTMESTDYSGAGSNGPLLVVWTKQRSQLLSVIRNIEYCLIGDGDDFDLVRPC